ncbi:MAG TPA: hypothetical protein VF185_02430 [Patescibacteria group bacterium]
MENKDIDQKPQPEVKKYVDTIPGQDHFQEDLIDPLTPIIRGGLGIGSWADLTGCTSLLNRMGIRRSRPSHTFKINAGK